MDHFPGDHGHDHHHGHDHDHAHGIGDYYLEQLLTIFISGAFGVVAILMYRFGMLNVILAPEFHVWVLAGGIALLVFTVIRAAALWSAAGAGAHHHHEHDHAHDHEHHYHDHDHEHAHDHHHEHAHAQGHSHDDGHSHGNIFWRIVVLAFPLLLFCLGLPNEGFSQKWINRRLGKEVEIGQVGDVADRGGNELLKFDFAEMNAAANDPGKRAEYEGRLVQVKGQLKQRSTREYTLFRMKMTCCAADTIPLKAVIVTKFAIPFQDFDWVRVRGRLQFVEVPGKNQYIPVIRVDDPQGIQKTQPEV
jgi:hypothetical protein